MSMIIKGMEMPKSCCDCSLTYYEPGEGSSCIFTEVPCLNIGRQDACPLVPLPEGHGRLIDADAFKADCLAATKDAKPDFIRHEDWIKSCAVTMSFCRDIDERPTIVPAEGGTNE